MLIDIFRLLSTTIITTLLSRISAWEPFSHTAANHRFIFCQSDVKWYHYFTLLPSPIPVWVKVFLYVTIWIHSVNCLLVSLFFPVGLFILFLPISACSLYIRCKPYTCSLCLNLFFTYWLGVIFCHRKINVCITNCLSFLL